ncbi:hypothetical protein DTL70_03825 [Streptomyces diacarni]|uniref:Hemerythrin-like domain-containing protein n=1 Tax=Streptomyces diacarni TaxID=2800381 RepID=A0A367FAU2_9ACTN|nr:hypothetical protein [Streptomyces diacarni]RCG27486.1 hypothetical protein DTL70_03825 [Streptomyces diacarni]
MAHKPEVTELLADAYAETERLVTAYEATRDPERRGALAEALDAGARRHALARERELDPVLRRVLPDGDRVAAAAARRAAAACAAVRRLQGLAPDAPAADREIAAVLDAVRAAARTDEEEVFPPLRDRLGHRARRELGAAVERALACGGARGV